MENDNQQQDPKQQPEIDLEHIAKMWPAAMAMATKMRRDEEVALEHMLAALVQDYLVARGTISEEQRALVQMEVHRVGELLPCYAVAYVRPGPGVEETPEHPRLVMCVLRSGSDEQEGHWEVQALPGEPF